jgi:hypothetical protein
MCILTYQPRNPHHCYKSHLSHKSHCSSMLTGSLASPLVAVLKSPLLRDQRSREHQRNNVDSPARNSHCVAGYHYRYLERRTDVFSLSSASSWYTTILPKSPSTMTNITTHGSERMAPLGGCINAAAGERSTKDRVVSLPSFSAAGRCCA